MDVCTNGENFGSKNILVPVAHYKHHIGIINLVNALSEVWSRYSVQPKLLVLSSMGVGKNPLEGVPPM